MGTYCCFQGYCWCWVVPRLAAVETRVRAETAETKAVTVAVTVEAERVRSLSSLVRS